MIPTTSNICFYTNKAQVLFTIIHVDDIQMMGSDLKKIDKLLSALYTKYN